MAATETICASEANELDRPRRSSMPSAVATIGQDPMHQAARDDDGQMSSELSTEE